MIETMPGRLAVPGNPYAFDIEHTAFVIIDMQADFCGKDRVPAA